MTAVSRAIIQLSGRDFIVRENMILSTFSLKKDIGQEINLPVLMSFDVNGKIITEKCTVKATVENNYKEKKVHAFKMKNRTRTRRLRGSRAHCTTIKINSLTIGGK
jgi:ribosomal protein L21